MKTLVVGATGYIGSAVVAALRARGHDVHAASRTSMLAVDATDPASITRLLAHTAPLDAVVAAFGSVPFKSFTELAVEDYLSSFRDKTLAQIDLARQSVDYLTDDGSITLTTGILARAPIRAGAAAAMANGALEAFVMAAAAELPRRLRINAVSPTVLTEATEYHPLFPGFEHVPGSSVAGCYIRSIENVETGRILVPN